MTKQLAITERRRDLVGSVASALVAVCLVLGMAARAEAHSGNVRYSYEQVEIGSRAQWVLLPEAESELKGEVTMQKYRKAFELLRDDKESSYGDSSLELEGSSPRDATATVRIDPDKSKFKLIIMAETVYTLTELGVDSVTFPDYAEGEVTRADIPFSAYTPTLPLWRALPSQTLVDARVRLPDGTVLSAEETARRFEQEDEKLVQAMYSYLEADQDYVVRSVAKRLPELDIPYAEQLLPLLENDSQRIRSTALDSLEDRRDRQEVLDAVVALLQREEKADLARKAANFLGESDRPEYNIHKQFFLLARGEPKERVAAAKALADRDDERAVDRLVDALGQDNEDVARRAVESLLELDAHDALAEALESDEIVDGVEMAMARGLTEEEAASAKVDGYAYLGRHAEGREAREAVRALEKVGTPGAREAAQSFLTADDRRLRLAAVETIEGLDSTDSLPAIADAVRALDKPQPVEDAGFAILRRRETKQILEYTGDSDSVVQRMAYRALGTKATGESVSDKVFETLKKGANHSDAAIRGAAVRGLGKLADERSLEILKDLDDDPNAKVRRGVAFALGNFEGGQMAETLNGYLDDDAPEVKAAALASLGKRGDKSSWDRIVELADSKHPEVRQRALEAVASLVDRSEDKDVREVISLLSGKVTSEENKAVLRTALEQLATFERKRAVNGIAIQMSAEDKDVRMAAIDALAKTGHKSAAGVLTGGLADPDPAIRRAIIEAIGELGVPSAREDLQARLTEEKNEDLKKLIEKTLERL